MFKAIVFDIGQTLVGYNKPLNWSALYRPALEHYLMWHMEWTINMFWMISLH